MKEAFLMKKRYLGIACAALVGGALVACGSGDVSKPSSEDEGNTVIFDSSYYVNRLDEATKACEADPVCAARMNGTSSVEISSSSSSEIIEPESSPGSSASVVPVPGSSSTQINFSSASVPTSSATIGGSSSSIVDDGTTLNGTCAPESTPIEKGAIAKWNFVRLTPAGMVGVTAQQNALFTWTMMGSSEGSFSAKGSQGGNTASATYPTSGDFTASLELDNGNKIQCSPLHVNGAKITGCECTADASTVDVASGSATAKWTISGCTTDATITGYTWADATGSGTLAMATLSTKGESIAPTVTVKNDDNTEVSVTCPAVKATDSSAPEYEITDSGNKNGLTFESNVDGVISMNLPSNWHGENATTCTFACQVNRGGSGSGSISGSIDGVALAGSDYVTATINVSSTIGGYSAPFVLNLNGNASATCFLNW